MVDMASKKYFKLYCVIQSSSNEKLICTFNQHCLSYQISNCLQFKSSMFSHKLFNMFLHWHTFFQHVSHVEITFIYPNNIYIYNTYALCLLLTCIKGKLVLLLDKTCYVSQETKPKFIGSQNFYFHFHYKLFCI